MNVSWLFGRLLASQEPWTGETLGKLPTRELRLVAQILAAPYSLPRQKLIDRLLATHRIRNDISAYSSDEEAIAEMWVSFTGSELKAMCAEMKLWRSGNKRQLAACLLNWRDRSRSQGTAAWYAIARKLDVRQQLLFPDS